MAREEVASTRTRKGASAPAKITRPRATGLVPRPRLFDWLEREAGRRMTWIVGPPGAGKTTLLGSYLEIGGLDHAWYQLDPGNADLATFFYSLGLAVQHSNQCRPLPTLSPENLPGFLAFARRYAETLGDTIRRPCALVFDNYDVRLFRGRAFRTSAPKGAGDPAADRAAVGHDSAAGGTPDRGTRHRRLAGGGIRPHRFGDELGSRGALIAASISSGRCWASGMAGKGPNTWNRPVAWRGRYKAGRRNTWYWKPRPQPRFRKAGTRRRWSAWRWR